MALLGRCGSTFHIHCDGNTGSFMSLNGIRTFSIHDAQPIPIDAHITDDQYLFSRWSVCVPDTI